jgi:hypothetical protein
MNDGRTDQAALSRELLRARAAAQRLQLAGALGDLRTASRPAAIARSTFRWARRSAYRRWDGASVAPLAASAAWWLLRRLLRSTKVRWALGAGLAATALWWVVRLQDPAGEDLPAQDASD